MKRRLFVLVLAAAAAFPAAASAAGPSAIAVDDNGVSYVGYPGAGQIARYGSGGNRLASWGTPGDAPGLLGGIVAIATAPAGDGSPAHTGDVWILDTNRRVQEFTRSGQFVQGIQLGPCDPGVTPNPLARGGIDVTYSFVYVAHPCADSVLKFSRSNLSTIATAPLTGPKGVAVQLYNTAPDASNVVFVAQPGKNQVSKLDKGDLSLIKVKPIDGTPSDVFTDAYGVLFVSDTANGVIHFYGSDGSEFRTLGHPPGGGALGDLRNPNAFDVFDQNDGGLNGNLFIADTGNQRIQRWNSYGYTYWGATANGPGGGGGGTAPVNTVPPQIQGSAVAGQTVTCTTGTWSNNPTSFTYEWERDATPITGERTNNDYTIQNADVGHDLTCTVTATNASGDGSATSAPVVPTAAAQAPTIVTRPQISGTPQPGNQLTCSQGTWNNNPTSFTYQWTIDGGVGIGTGNTYMVKNSDVGHAIVCSVTASNAAGSNTADSDPVTITAGGCTDGSHGVSINSGAVFTNSPGVTLKIHEPAGATSVLISNDGGFATPTTVAVSCTDSYAWTLVDSGPERLPKTVYVRFTGTGNPDQTFTDDIILDQTAPKVKRATVNLSSSVLRVRAHDASSGVAKLELSQGRSGRHVKTVPYRHSQRIRNARHFGYVRAIDAAGNVGAWRPLAHTF